MAGERSGVRGGRLQDESAEAAPGAAPSSASGSVDVGKPAGATSTTDIMRARAVEPIAPKIPKERLERFEAARRDKKRYLCFILADAETKQPPCWSITIAGIVFAVYNDKPRHSEEDPQIRAPGHPNWISPEQLAEFERVVDYCAIRWNEKTRESTVMWTNSQNYSPDPADVSIRAYLHYREWPEGESRFEAAPVAVERSRARGTLAAARGLTAS